MIYTSLMEAQGTIRSRFFWRRVLLAPTCLMLVAGLHLARVVAHHQSAWKGGGFGMFSTVDAPQARFLRVFVETDRERLPVAIPARLQKIASELRTAPNQARMKELAAQLAQISWVDEHARSATIARRLAARDCSAPLTAATLRTRRLPTNVEPPCTPQGTPSSLVAVGSVDKRRERGDLVPVESVVIELWRYEYDASTNLFSARPWLVAKAQ